MPKVFAIGDLNIDLFTYTNDNFVLGEEHSAKNFSYSIGGNAANFAVGLGALNDNVTLISTLGNDIFSQFLLHTLRSHGVKHDLLRSSEHNGASNIIVRSDAERAIISYKGPLLDLNCSAVSKKLLPHLSKGDIVYFGGYFHLKGMKNGFTGLLKKIKRKGAKVFFDAAFDEYGKWDIKPFIKYVDIFFLNTLELEKITHKKNKKSAVKKLFFLGARQIVLKSGKKGASYFSSLYTLDSAPQNVRALNTTGAGDFFNAGFVHGFVNGFSIKNSLALANFVSSKKISAPFYSAPKLKDVKIFLRSKNLAGVEVEGDYSKLSKRASEFIIGQLNEKPDSVLSLAAGKTPVKTYKLLVNAYRAGRVDFSKAVFIELDEYLGEIEQKDAFGYFLKKNLIDKVNFKKENVFLFNPYSANLSRDCKRFDSIVRSKGIDFLLLGIGGNAHIAFNEPGTLFSSKTHVLDVSKRILRARKQKFSKKIPARAITLGMSAIINAKRVVVIANGEKKSKAVYLSLTGKPRISVPASMLQSHPNSTFVADKKAYKI